MSTKSKIGRTLKASLNTAWMQGIDVDVVFFVQIQFFLEASHCTNQSSLAAGVLNIHGAIDGAGTRISKINVAVPRSNVDNTSFVSFSKFREYFVHQVHGLGQQS
jgi:hypothetical protein